jgi:hypothetical protein
MDESSMDEGMILLAMIFVGIASGLMGGIFGGLAVWFLTH